MNLLKHLPKRSNPFVLALGFLLIVLVGTIDYVTGPEISFSIFYLIPVSLVAWIVGKRSGILISTTGAIAWLMADQLSGHSYSNAAIPYWNAIVRLGFFLVVTYALATLKTSQERREELAQFVIHDLRSPLSNIIEGLHVLQDVSGETMDSSQKDLVRMCMISASRLLTLIKSMLDLARLESGRMLLHPGEINVNELVESSLDQVSVWARKNRVVLIPQVRANVQKIFADPVVTERILVNLLSNAIKFSHPDSAVIVRVEPFSPSSIAISITDTGTGISKEWADKVFEKFAQAELGKTRGDVGTGLGLTFCRLAVKAQGGDIWLESEINVGTTITFTLPKGG